MTVVRFQNFADEGITGQVWVRDTTHVMGGYWAFPVIYPVGHILLSATVDNPATWLGYGTWSQVGQSRCLVGDDGGGSYPIGATGGATSTTHSHSYGTLATSGGSWHSHGAGTIATVAESSHTHGVGTIDAGVHSSHNHDYGTLATSAHSSETLTAHSWDHKHDITTAGNATISAHTSHGHGSKTATFSSGSSPYFDTATTQGVHTLGGATELVASYAALTHSAHSHTPHIMSGFTGNGGAVLSHSMTGSTAAGSSHSHGVTGSTASEGAHIHSMSGSTGSDATSVMQPYLVVRFWQRTV